jgi:hypothetical protein
MHKKEQKEAKLIMERRKGIMDKSTFRKIWGCLSPESLPRLTGIPRDKLREDVVAIYEKIFNSVKSIVVTPRALYKDGDTIIAELLISINSDEQILVTDIITFNEAGKIISVRAYKG